MRLIGLTVTLMTLAVVFPTAAFAQSEYAQWHPQMAPRSAVLLSGEVVALYRTGADGYSVMDRWAKANDRMVRILADPNVGANDVRVRRVGNRAEIRVGNHLFATLTQADARAAKVRSPYVLASTWAQSLRQGIAYASIGTLNDGILGGR